MTSTLDRHRADLRKLLDLGNDIAADLAIQAMERKGALDEEHKKLQAKVQGTFQESYQRWYTESCAVIRQIIPERLTEFEALYKGDDRRKKIDLVTYTIQDWFRGIRSIEDIFTGQEGFDDLGAMVMRYQIQLEILKSVEGRFESSLFDIKQLVQADLFDSELEASRELLKNGFKRAAGVVSGVVLESHLSQVCTGHSATTRKRHPTISDYNDLLKKNSVIDVPMWRFVQRLGDLRNLCGHKRTREPTDDEVQELIDGVEKTTKTLY